jgi:hypothetical protein
MVIAQWTMVWWCAGRRSAGLADGLGSLDRLGTDPGRSREGGLGDRPLAVRHVRGITRHPGTGPIPPGQQRHATVGILAPRRLQKPYGLLPLVIGRQRPAPASSVSKQA